jgi:hypothetical protein
VTVTNTRPPNRNMLQLPLGPLALRVASSTGAYALDTTTAGSGRRLRLAERSGANDLDADRRAAPGSFVTAARESAPCTMLAIKVVVPLTAQLTSCRCL